MIDQGLIGIIGLVGVGLFVMGIVVGWSIHEERDDRDEGDWL